MPKPSERTTRPNEDRLAVMVADAAVVVMVATVDMVMVAVAEVMVAVDMAAMVEMLPCL